MTKCQVETQNCDQRGISSYLWLPFAMLQFFMNPVPVKKYELIGQIFDHSHNCVIKASIKDTLDSKARMYRVIRVMRYW